MRRRRLESLKNDYTFGSLTASAAITTGIGLCWWSAQKLWNEMSYTFYEQQKKRPLQQGGGSRNQPQIKKFQGNNGQWKGQGSNMAPRENEGQPGPRCHKFHLGNESLVAGITCFSCGQLGHYSHDCLARKNGPPQP